MECTNFNKKQLAEIVLDYWYTMEFLSQDSYPNSKKICNQDVQSTKSPMAFLRLYESENLLGKIKQEVKNHQKQDYGNLTVYIGRVQREACTACIAQALGAANNESQEKNRDKIAWASLQLTPEGKYKRYSLSLSPVLWALRQVSCDRDVTHAHNCLNRDIYDNDIKQLEAECFGQHMRENLLVGMKDIVKLASVIEYRYLRGYVENTDNEQDIREKIYAVSFQMFSDKRTDQEDENDIKLNHDFFSNEIKYILEQIRNGHLEQMGPMGKELLAYITAPYEADNRSNNRFDLITPEGSQRTQFLNLLNDILAVENAPLGKWPSRFMPAFMQQVAINLAVGKGRSQAFMAKGAIFSVNGPPGTGKTTLLKEIIVSNVVERAILLAQYEEPDEAFDPHIFPYEADDSYHINQWYSFKNDKLNNYSTLVTSCNNAAVENISKELPKNVKNDLKPLDGDSKELKYMLEQTQKLFDAEAYDTEENAYGMYAHELHRDICFTKYARNLLNDKEAWGLAAVALGNKKNLTYFYNKVLKPMGEQYFKDGHTAKSQITLYRQARQEFNQQLNVVEKIQKSLGIAGHLHRQLSSAKQNRIEIAQKYKEASTAGIQTIHKAEQYQRELAAYIISQEADIRTIEKEIDALENDLAIIDAKTRKVDEEIHCVLQEELSARRSANMFTKLFQKAKYQAALKLADADKHKAEQLEEERQTLNAKIEEVAQQICLARKQIEKARNAIEKTEQEKDELSAKIITEEQTINGYKGMLDAENEQIQYLQSEYEAAVTKFTGNDDVDTGVVLDEVFITKLLSENAQESATAHVDNPWFTQRYNREREKLFACAMRLTKEFIAASNACQSNLVILGQYWGFRQTKQQKRIRFSEKDTQEFVPSLLQTLFLMVPVVSSTFASVGSLMRDAKRPGVIGLLIVDEAGQAPPQAALGALYRSRKAIIVGDPKQVEPVVTDDLIQLKKAFNDQRLEPYKRKSISVQSFADSLNPYGAFLNDNANEPDWVGCPLVVHRRCISPMYDISNRLSYNGIMKQQTRLPAPKLENEFIYNHSAWIQVEGYEKGNKDHFVNEQGKKVCELLEIAFEKTPNPSLYIISPFTTVVTGIKKYIQCYCNEHSQKGIATKIDQGYMLDSLQKRIGTVHTFQGKEANEVILLLGCDTGSGASGAIEWVNTNIVNVAATRAKYRLYVVGDASAWKKSHCVDMMRKIMQETSNSSNIISSERNGQAPKIGWPKEY